MDYPEYRSTFCDHENGPDTLEAVRESVYIRSAEA